MQNHEVLEILFQTMNFISNHEILEILTMHNISQSIPILISDPYENELLLKSIVIII